MSTIFGDPSLLTSDRLKEELKKHHVSLPAGRPSKQNLLKLYERHVSRKAGRAASFSSDEDEDESFTQSRRKAGRPRAAAPRQRGKPVVRDEISTLSDRDLATRLRSLGYSPGPVVASTRPMYEKKLSELMSKGGARNQQTDETYSDDEEEEQEEEEMEEEEQEEEEMEKEEEEEEEEEMDTYDYGGGHRPTARTEIREVRPRNTGSGGHREPIVRFNKTASDQTDGKSKTTTTIKSTTTKRTTHVQARRSVQEKVSSGWALCFLMLLIAAAVVVLVSNFEARRLNVPSNQLN